MKAMVLTAGFGTRLKPHTKWRAKPALTLMGIPIIKYILSQLHKAGVRECILNLHHLPETVVDAVKDIDPKLMKIKFSYEKAILGTAGGLKNAERYFDDSEIFIMANSDIIMNINLKDAISLHKTKDALATMVLYNGPGSKDFPQIGINSLNKIRYFVDKNYSNEENLSLGSFTGVHIFNRQIFLEIPPRQYTEINLHVYPRMLQTGARVYGYMHNGFWIDVGHIEKLHELHLEILKGRSQINTILDKTPLLALEGKLFNEDTDMGEGKNIKAPSYLGSNVILEKKVTIGPFSVIGQNCRIGQNARIERSIVFDDTTIPAHKSAFNQIISAVNLDQLYDSDKS